MKRADIKIGETYRVEDAWPAKVTVRKIAVDGAHRTVVYGTLVTPATGDGGVAWDRFGSELTGLWDDRDQTELEEWCAADRIIKAMRAAGVTVHRDYTYSGQFTIDRAALGLFHDYMVRMHLSLPTAVES